MNDRCIFWRDDPDCLACPCGHAVCEYCLKEEALAEADMPVIVRVPPAGEGEGK